MDKMLLIYTQIVFGIPSLLLSYILSKLIVIFQLMIKKEPIRLNMKKVECNLHGNPIKFKCESPSCDSPYLCSDIDCLDHHFHHEGRLILAKFNANEWECKFQEVENVLNNDTLKVKEEYLTKVIQYFNGNLRKIQQDMKKFEKIKVDFSSNDSSALTADQFSNVNGFLALGSKLERKIDKLQSKINEQEMSFEDSSSFEPNEVEEVISPAAQREISPEEVNVEPERPESNEHNEENNQQIGNGCNAEEMFPETTKETIQISPYYQNQDLAKFLDKSINNFNWSHSKIIFSSNSTLTTCEKFHEKLRGMTNLLFLFLGEGPMIGSFYHEPYPAISERHKKDDNSFIFIQDLTLEDKFAYFTANPECEFHISVSEKLLVCQGNTPNNGDGLRTFQRNFDSLVYFMPSRSFKDTIEDREVTYNGMLKVKQFFVLKLFDVDL